jgi:hypothetical protein
LQEFQGYRQIDCALSTPSINVFLNEPQLSSKTDAEREAKLTELNGKPYTVAKAEFDKSCPLVANGAASSVVR